MGNGFMSDTLLRVKKLVAEGKVRVSDHGYDELADDDMLAIDVLRGAQAAVVVEDYPQFGERTERFGSAEGFGR